jgi:DMSO/TMAO reductase YedYZ molybdopterin-dependent catalytic subunit
VISQKILGFVLFLVILNACAAGKSAAPVPSFEATAEVMYASSPTPTVNPTRVEPTLTPVSALTSTVASDSGGQCVLTPVVVPTKPDIIPKSLELDETTGMHMTGFVQELDITSYRLMVSGKVDHPLSLSYDDLRCLPKVTTSASVSCGGFFTDSATWSGVPIRDILTLAGVQPDAVAVKLVSADDYFVNISIEAAFDPHNFLAYEWQGQPLPILHGFPVRAVFPGMPGNQWLKWLVEVVAY